MCTMIRCTPARTLGEELRTALVARCTYNHIMLLEKSSYYVNSGLHSVYVVLAVVVYCETVVVTVLVGTNEVTVGVTVKEVVEAHTSLTMIVVSRFFWGGG